MVRKIGAKNASVSSGLPHFAVGSASIGGREDPNGWTSVFIVTGGTEIRGPHAIIGVHNVLATHRAVEAARRLGRTIVAPTIPDGSPRANNGLSGNPHPATKEIGRDLAEIGIMNTVNQVRALLAQRSK
jgi:creatinine amidohydrolase/Fe(II)-dependent formamide hydrolase-like protein